MAINIQKLNDDCLLHIFQYLPIVDKVRIERVCHRWRALSMESWRTFKRFDLSRTTWGLPESDKFTYIDTQILKKILSRCGRFLIYFDICKPFNEDGTITRKDQNKVHIIGATGDVLKIVESTCPDLQTIFISDPCVNLLGLRSLIFKNRSITKFCLVSKKWIWEEEKLGEIFASMSKLKYLKLSCNNLTGKCLLSLSNQVEEIHLLRMIHSSSRHVSNAINRFYMLKSLTIDSYPTIDVELLKAIGSRNDNLRELRLSGYVGLDRIKKQEIREIAKFENLKILDFQHNCYITNEALETLAVSCKKVQYINISYCFEISEKGIVHLATKSKLEYLIANGLPKITGENFAKMVHLKTLECRNCHRLREESLCNLVWCSPNLEILDASWNKFNVDILISMANVATRSRTRVVLKLYVGHTSMNPIKISSTFLNVINSSSEQMCRDFLNEI